jgi:integrase
MIKIREYSKRGKTGWEVDITIRLPSGEVIRERVKSPVTSKSGAMDWARAREAVLLREGSTEKKKVAPTLAEFWPDFMEGHVRANRQKHSTVITTESIYKAHLKPAFGAIRLDAISDDTVQTFKGALSKRAPKTVNNILTVLSKALRVAVEWGRLDRLHCRVKLVKVQKTEIEFYEPEDYERLLEGAEKADARTYLVTLLGGDAGLRIGEMLGLEWTDIDLRRRQLTVQRNEWQGVVGAPKGGQARVVPMTARLAAALEAQRNLRTRVLTKDDGSSFDWDVARDKMRTAQRRAGMEADGGRCNLASAEAHDSQDGSTLSIAGICRTT